MTKTIAISSLNLVCNKRHTYAGISRQAHEQNNERSVGAAQCELSTY
jgi:hypothetical protein